MKAPNGSVAMTLTWLGRAALYVAFARRRSAGSCHQVRRPAHASGRDALRWAWSSLLPASSPRSR